MLKANFGAVLEKGLAVLGISTKIIMDELGFDDHSIELLGSSLSWTEVQDLKLREHKRSSTDG